MVGGNSLKLGDDSSSRGQEVLRQEVTKNIRALLISAPNGLSEAEMQRDYNNMVGKPLPFRELGYERLISLLKDLPNVARPTWENGVLVLRGIADATTKHIANLVARQRKSSSKRKTRITTYHPEPEPIVPHFLRTQLKELLSAYPSGVLGSMFSIAFKRRFGRELSFDKLGFNSLSALLYSVPDIVRIEQMRGGGFRVYNKEHVSIAPSDTGKAPDPGDSFSVRTQSGSTFSQSTVDQRSHNLAPSQSVSRKGSEARKNDSVMSIKAKLDSNSGIDKQLQEECKQVLARRPNGIWAARFGIEYKNLHRKELSIKQLGFMSMVEFMSAMPDVVRIERPTKLDWLLFEVKEVKEEEDHSKSNGEVCKPEEKSKATTSGPVAGNPLNLPDGVGRGIYYSKIEPPECGYIEVCVTHVIDPTRFWVMMIENWPSLEALTENMRRFYSSRDSARYKMPEWFISVGQACCALYEDGSWYRGLVVGVQSVDSIEIFYVDYGNSARLPLSSLRVLRSQFVRLPAQAIPSKLAYIQPAIEGTDWSPTSTHRFYHLTKDYRQLVGIVCGVQEGTLSLCLCDTNAQEDLHINDELVREGYAIAVLQPENPPVAGQDHDRKASPVSQPVQHAPLGITHAGKGLTNQQVPNFLCAPLGNPSLLPDFPLQIGMPYSSDVARWLDQTAPFTGAFTCMNPYVLPQQLTGNPLSQPSAPSNDDLELMEEINQELAVDTPTAKGNGFVKRLQLSEGQCLHVINFDNKPHVISAEVSALFWDSDLLRSMLRQKKKTVAKLVVSFSENESLFEELIRCGVAGVTEGDQPRSSVTLYELDSLPDILGTFNHPSEELLLCVMEELECFGREGEKYWFSKKEEDGEAETGSSSEEPWSETELGIDELQLLLQAMQFRRKRILQGLMTGATNPARGHVDELNEVEMKIEGLRQEIQIKEHKNTITIRTQPAAARTT